MPKVECQKVMSLELKTKKGSCIILNFPKFLKEHPYTKIQDFQNICMPIHCAVYVYAICT